MGKKFTNTSYDTDGNAWTIDIYDSTFSGTVTDFLIVDKSLRINYEGDRTSPILSSSCDFTMIINSTVLLTFINGLAASEENKFRVKILREGSIEWAGVLLSDQISYLDAQYPFELAITATDGINRLQKIEYYDDSGESPVPYEGRETFISHYINIIEKIGLSDLLESNVLRTSVAWYETNHVSTNIDPLAQTRFDHRTLLEFDEKTGEPKYTSALDVLKTLTENWGARFVQSKGAFRIVQVNGYVADSFPEFQYNASGVQQASSTGNSFGKSLLRKVAGGTISFLPGLRKVEMEYIHRLASNLIAGADISVATTIEDVDNNGNVQIYFSSVAQAVTEDLQKSVYIKYKVRIQLGDLYYKRTGTINDLGIPEYTDPEWSIGAGDYDLFSQLIPKEAGTHTTQINILISEIPQNADLTLSARFDNFLEADNSIDPLNPVPAVFFLDSYLEIADLTDRSNSKLYEALNSTDGYSEAKELTSFIGDGPTGNAFGNLEVYDGTNWVVSGSWANGNTSGGDEFHQLLINEILAGQTTPLRVRQSSYIDLLRAHECLVSDSANHYPINMTIDALSGIVEGSFVTAQTAFGDVSPQTPKEFFVPVRQPSTGPINTPTIDVPLGNGNIPREGQETEDRVDIALRIPPFTVSDDIAPGSTITSIPVTEATDNDLFVTGDRIKVVDRFTGEVETFVVAADVVAGDTSITIEEATTINNISDNSYVALDPSDLHAKLNKKWYRQRLLNHNSDTLTVTENGGILPGDAAAIHVYANGQRIFNYTVDGSDIDLGYTPNGLDFVVEFFA